MPDKEDHRPLGTFRSEPESQKQMRGKNRCETTPAVATPDAAMIHPKVAVNIYPTIQIVLRIDIRRGERPLECRNMLLRVPAFCAPDH